jgi:hypothetical protein
MLSMLFVQQLMIVLNAKIALGREKIQIKDIVFFDCRSISDWVSE